MELSALAWFVLGALVLIGGSVVVGFIYAAFGSPNPADNPDSSCSRCEYGPDFPACPNQRSLDVDMESGPETCDSFRPAQPGPTASAT